jgi:acyl dehydratase
VTTWDAIVGSSFTSQGRTFTDAEIALMTDLTWTGHDLHSNAVAMRSTPMGERVLAGPCVLACALGQLASAGWELILQRDFGVRAVALLGTENLRFEQPIVPGSTMIVHNKVQTARASSSRPDHGVITTEVRGVDAENEKRTFVRLIEVTLLRRLDGA